MPRDVRLETTEKGLDCDGEGGSQCPAEVMSSKDFGYAGIFELVNKCTI